MKEQVLREQFKVYLESEKISLYPHAEDLKICFHTNKGSFSNDFFVISVQAIFNYIDKIISHKAYKNILNKIKPYLYIHSMQRRNILEGRYFFITSNYKSYSKQRQLRLPRPSLNLKALLDTTPEDDYSFRSAYYLFENKAFYDALKKIEEEYPSYDDRKHLSEALVILGAPPADKPEITDSTTKSMPPESRKRPRINHAWVNFAIRIVKEDNTRIHRTGENKLTNLNQLAKACQKPRSTISRYFENHGAEQLAQYWKKDGIRRT